MKKLFYSLFITLSLFGTTLNAQELIIGEETVQPGIVFIFEGAIKDDVTPHGMHLVESETDVHLEARVNWASDESITVPKGTPRGGFIPYITITAEVINEATGKKLSNIEIVPHINLIDNFHYARNIKLPGERDQRYTVIFHVEPPSPELLGLHKDWRDQYGNQLFQATSFRYTNVDFEEIANASRR